MEWNTNMEEAPRELTLSRRYTHHKTGGAFSRDISMKVPILISVGDEVYRSFWSEERQHWSGITVHETPNAWMPWPEPYREEL